MAIIFDVRFDNDTVFQLLDVQFQSETIVSKPPLLRRKLPNNPGCILGVQTASQHFENFRLVSIW